MMKWKAKALLALAGTGNLFNAELWFQAESQEEATRIAHQWAIKFQDYGMYVNTIELNERG